MQKRLIAIVGLCFIPFAVALAETPGAADAGREARRAEMRERMFKAIDIDGDGRISQAEYAKSADERFLRMDADKNGFVTQEELSQLRAEMRKKGETKRSRN